MKLNYTASYCNFNKVFTIKNTESVPGFEIKLNPRFWGIALSWGDSIHWKKDGDCTSIWFFGIQIGPIFLIWQWNRKAKVEPFESFSKKDV